MHTIDTVVVGAGQAGLATSHELTRLGHEHVVLDRLAVGDRWLHRRWDTQTLLTPNWMTRLPGHRYEGADPDGFMTTAEFAFELRKYALRSGAPIVGGAAVERVVPRDDRLEVTTPSGTWSARNVIVATGWCDVHAVPAAAATLHPSIHSLVSDEYRNPSALPEGGVLIVGASATGAQLADELRRDGRRIVLAVGGHVRLPRRYRGADIMEWMDRAGTLDRRIEDMPDPVAATREPAAQLVGASGEPRTIDLPSLAGRGVELVGRFLGADGRSAHFDERLAERMSRADLIMHRTLDRFDGYIERAGIHAAEPHRPPPVAAPAAPTTLDLVGAGIRTVIWASGYRRDYSWLPPLLIDARGELRHHRGVTGIPGVTAVGLRFQRTRRSNFIDGVGADATIAAERAHARAAATAAA
ncbi:NAD(P)-binding domain-containing protein [Agromyces bauzanensis]